ncbi:MAG: YchF/TatD family DNA exonuclease [Nitrospinae bacterium]|nr:YchF/TatD family DNA exonuclease [Nitrospinota bacterium]
MPADSHCHLNDPAFEADREEAIARAQEAGVSLILNVGYDAPTSHLGIKLAERHGWMYASAGIHPNSATMADGKTLSTIRDLAKHPAVVAIGETGLDYYRDRAPKDVQENSFRAHIAIARELGKPVIIHCRDAYEDALRILKEEEIEKTGGVMHCFGGSPEEARKFLELNLHISFAGNITYPKAGGLREAVKAVPGHRLLIETDAPYLAPQKNRGARNEPSYLPEVAKTAAETRGVTYEDIQRISVTNFEELFNIGGAKEGEIVYKIRDSLYLNVTRACTNRCYFCPRFYSDTIQGHNLRLTRDPSAEELIEAIGDPENYSEIVFCGYGEPTLRLNVILAVAKWVKENGGVTRLNTNGHGNHIAKRDIIPEIAGLIDTVSVSLNATDPQIYDEICDPQIPHAWEATVEFIKLCKGRIPKVTATVVAIPDKVDIETARRFVEDGLGVKFRVREYNLVG